MDYQALKNVPVLLVAAGGSDRHAVVIDHQLRPLFGFFRAHSLPFGVYAQESDFSSAEADGGYEINNPALRDRIEQAIGPAVKLFQSLHGHAERAA